MGAAMRTNICALTLVHARELQIFECMVAWWLQEYYVRKILSRRLKAVDVSHHDFHNGTKPDIPYSDWSMVFPQMHKLLVLPGFVIIRRQRALPQYKQSNFWFEKKWPRHLQGLDLLRNLQKKLKSHWVQPLLSPNLYSCFSLLCITKGTPTIPKNYASFEDWLLVLPSEIGGCNLRSFSPKKNWR